MHRRLIRFALTQMVFGGPAALMLGIELAAHIGVRAVSCASNGSDAYKRALAICSLAGEDLNAWMVQQGWALAYVHYSSAYRKVEDDARTHQRGLWRGAFIAPWDWRHRNTKTVILGAFSVPVAAQAMLLASLRDRRRAIARMHD